MSEKADDKKGLNISIFDLFFYNRSSWAGRKAGRQEGRKAENNLEDSSFQKSVREEKRQEEGGGEDQRHRYDMPGCRSCILYF